jgi:hypothetical protein
MEKSPKRLDRRTFWMWVVLLVLGHVFANVSMPHVPAALLPMIGIDEVILILLAIALARRFRDIGWPVWIGPTILLVTIGLPFLGIGIIAMMNHAGDQIMQWLPLYGLISGPLNLVLLIVAGVVPGKARAENIEISGLSLRPLHLQPSKGGTVRPKSIVYFEWIILGTVLLGALQSYLSWDQTIEVAATVYRNSAIAFNLIIQIFSFVLPGTLALLVSRRRSKTAMWVSIVLYTIGIPLVVSDIICGQLLGSDIVAALMSTGQVVACGLLFTLSARRWMNREDEKEREAA